MTRWSDPTRPNVQGKLGPDPTQPVDGPNAFGLSPFPKCIIITSCLLVPVSAKMYHGFKYSFMQHRINICAHWARTGTRRHVIMMHFGNGDHRRAVGQTCANGDWLNQWRMAKFDPSQLLRDPSTDRQKIWNRWLRRRHDPLCKI